MSARPRLVIVGGGVIGTMHALQGLGRGYEVLQIERDPLPRGASVRNFGLVWVGGRADGVELDLALVARELWEQIATDRSNVHFRGVGSLTVARTEVEFGALELAMNLKDTSARGFELLDAAETRSRCSALQGKLFGSLFCSMDAIVEPRLVLGQLREVLMADANYHWLANRHVMEVRPHAVRDHLGDWHQGDLVVCCIGAFPGGFIAEALKDTPLRRVRLQMLETEPFDAGLSTALADGDSLRYYPAYKEAAATLGAQESTASEWAAQLLCVQRLNGCLTIGDTHSYEEPFAFDTDETPYRHLLSVAKDIIGAIPPVQRRWAGVYSQVTDPTLMYFRQEIEPGVVVVTGPGGRGMTMSPAIARETFL